MADDVSADKLLRALVQLRDTSLDHVLMRAELGELSFRGCFSDAQLCQTMAVGLLALKYRELPSKVVEAITSAATNLNDTLQKANSFQLSELRNNPDAQPIIGR